MFLRYTVLFFVKLCIFENKRYKNIHNVLYVVRLNGFVVTYNFHNIFNIKLIDEEIKLYTCVCYISHFVHLKFHTESGYRFDLKNEKYNMCMHEYNLPYRVVGPYRLTTLYGRLARIVIHTNSIRNHIFKEKYIHFIKSNYNEMFVESFFPLFFFFFDA